MQASRITRIAATAVAMALILATVGSHAAEQAAKAPAGWVDAEALGGEHRYLTHISTDKPIYRAGEKVYIRAVVLHAVSRAPLPAREQQHWAQFEVTGPRGDTVAQGQSRVQDSVVGFFWQVPDGQAGGEYTIKVSHPGSGYTPAERSFDIRAYRAPRLKNQITFLRDGYGPGDIVAVNVRSERAEGGTPNGANVTVTARVDGEEVYRGNTTVGDDRYATARFDLPERIARGEGTVAFAIEDGGVVETATKTIPILLQTVDLGIYPESGELVTGVLSRVYVEARTPAKKPADLAGVIVDVSPPYLVAAVATACTPPSRWASRPCTTFPRRRIVAW